jgi:hypothetical protein
MLGIDPGTEKTAVVYWNTEEKTILQAATLPNAEALSLFRSLPRDCGAVALETITLYKKAGREVGETLCLVGQIMEAARGRNVFRITRTSIRNHFCGKFAANDAGVRKALIQRFGMLKLKNDEWQALALAVFFGDTHKETA